MNTLARLPKFQELDFRLNLVSGYNFGSWAHRCHGATVLVRRESYRAFDRFCRYVASADYVLEIEALEGARMFLAPRGTNLDMVGGHLFALFLED